jgi:hypothetical protein
VFPDRIPCGTLPLHPSTSQAPSLEEYTTKGQEGKGSQTRKKFF